MCINITTIKYGLDKKKEKKKTRTQSHCMEKASDLSTYGMSCLKSRNMKTVDKLRQVGKKQHESSIGKVRTLVRTTNDKINRRVKCHFHSLPIGSCARTDHNSETPLLPLATLNVATLSKRLK